MKPTSIVVAAAAALGLLATVLHFVDPRADAGSTSASATAQVPSAALPAAMPRPASAALAPPSAPSSPSVAAHTPEQVVADARLHGDERAPPIDAPAVEPPPAMPWEVADPALYQAREQRMTEEMHARFVQASEQRLVTLRAAVDRLRAEGVSPDLLAMAEDKVRHLQAVHDAIVNGEPLGATR